MSGVISIDAIKSQIITLLPFTEDSEDFYDNQLDILIKGAISKLRGEGVDIEAQDSNGDYFFTEDSYNTSDYIVCLAYQILKDMDFDVDYNFMTEQYITRVNTLRCFITAKQN